MVRLLLTPLYLFAQRFAGIRPAHLYGAAFAAVALLVALAVPFWWLGEQASGAAGIFGALFVLAAYFATATAALVMFTLLLARLLLGRFRRAFGAL